MKKPERELCTPVLHMEYDFRTRVGILYLPPGCCTDMGGAINFFTRLDPDVLQIQTVAGKTKDTIYDRQWGAWRAHPLRTSAVRLKNFAMEEGR